MGQLFCLTFPRWKAALSAHGTSSDLKRLMKRIASLVLALFVANLVFAAVGPHCIDGFFTLDAQAAAASEPAHNHDEPHHKPVPDPVQGELCSSMQLTAALSTIAMPKPTQIETNVIWAVASIFIVTVDHLHAKPNAAGPPPPLLASNFHTVHARTGRLLI